MTYSRRSSPTGADRDRQAPTAVRRRQLSDRRRQAHSCQAPTALRQAPTVAAALRQSPTILCVKTPKKSAPVGFHRFLLSLQAKYYIPDASINLLINFLFIFISVTGRFSTFMKCLANIFPKSLSLLLKMVKAGQDYTKFVIVQVC